MRRHALQAQVYEKIDAGVWFDKGIFNLIEAAMLPIDGRKVCRLSLRPADADAANANSTMAWRERMIPASEKAAIWQRDEGRCSTCSSELSLHFDTDISPISLRCVAHSSTPRNTGLL